MILVYVNHHQYNILTLTGDDYISTNYAVDITNHILRMAYSTVDTFTINNKIPHNTIVQTDYNSSHHAMTKQK